MTLLLDIIDRLFSWLLLGAAVFTIWVASILIREQDATNEPDDIKQEWATVREAFRFNATMIYDHLRKRKHDCLRHLRDRH